MKKFLAIYLGTPNDEKFKEWMVQPEEIKQKVMQEGMAAWGKWAQDNAAVILDMGGPLGKTKKADKTGISDTKNAMSGYAVVQAESHDAAATLFENHPHFSIFPGESVEIMEILPMPGEKA